VTDKNNHDYFTMDTKKLQVIFLAIYAIID